MKNKSLIFHEYSQSLLYYGNYYVYENKHKMSLITQNTEVIHNVLPLYFVAKVCIYLAFSINLLQFKNQYKINTNLCD